MSALHLTKCTSKPENNFRLSVLPLICLFSRFIRKHNARLAFFRYILEYENLVRQISNAS